MSKSNNQILFRMRSFDEFRTVMKVQNYLDSNDIEHKRLAGGVILWSVSEEDYVRIVLRFGDEIIRVNYD